MAVNKDHVVQLAAELFQTIRTSSKTIGSPENPLTGEEVHRALNLLALRLAKMELPLLLLRDQIDDIFGE